MKPSKSVRTTPHSLSTDYARKPSPARKPAVQPSPGGACAGKHILLVDDDSTERDSLKEVLVEEGYVVIPAENGQQALDLANRWSVDLVLLDLNMPVKSGWDTFEQLTREHPILPIIIITARPNQAFTALSAGAGALLEKPMDIPTLLQTIERLRAEPNERRLARLVGKDTEFQYNPAKTVEKNDPTNRR